MAATKFLWAVLISAIFTLETVHGMFENMPMSQMAAEVNEELNEERESGDAAAKISPLQKYLVNRKKKLVRHMLLNLTPSGAEDLQYLNETLSAKNWSLLESRMNAASPSGTRKALLMMSHSASSDPEKITGLEVAGIVGGTTALIGAVGSWWGR